ncbi:hypothetical protein GEMRC1_001379 [Eukaryota sp. GEM-RC1]
MEGERKKSKNLRFISPPSFDIYLPIKDEFLKDALESKSLKTVTAHLGFVNTKIDLSIPQMFVYWYNKDPEEMKVCIDYCQQDAIVTAMVCANFKMFSTLISKAQFFEIIPTVLKDAGNSLLISNFTIKQLYHDNMVGVTTSVPRIYQEFGSKTSPCCAYEKIDYVYETDMGNDVHQMDFVHVNNEGGLTKVIITGLQLLVTSVDLSSCYSAIKEGGGVDPSAMVSFKF